MNRLLRNRVKIKRNVIGYKPGSKTPMHRVEVVYDGLPARICDKKLYIKYRNMGEITHIQKGDIVEDSTTGFEYSIADHPQLGGGMLHHWEASMEVLVDK